MRINVAYAVPPQSKKATLWHDGFTAGMELIAETHTVRWLNVHPDTPALETNLAQLDDGDFLLVKSNWDWIVDRAVRRHCARASIPKGLLISGVGKPPAPRKMRFYDVLFYQTKWYELQLVAHPLRFHTYGIDTSVMSPRAGVEKDIDWLSVGQILPYKRHEWLLDKTGRRVVIGDLTQCDQALHRRLVDGGVEIVDFVDYPTLADYYRRSHTVLVACTVDGGGERALMEALACGTHVEIAPDNPKLREIYEQPRVWDHHYYAQQLLLGIEEATKAKPQAQARTGRFGGRFSSLSIFRSR